MVLETGGSSTVKLAQLLAQGEQPVRRIPPGGCHDVITTTELSSGHALPGNPTTRRDSHFGPRGEGSPSRRGQRCGVARPQLERAGQASRSASPTTPDGGTGCGGCPAGDSGPQVERHAVGPVGAGHVPGDLGEPLAADAGADRVAVDVLGGPADVVGTQEQAAFEDEAAGVPGDRQPVEERLQRVPGQVLVGGCRLAVLEGLRAGATLQFVEDLPARPGTWSEWPAEAAAVWVMGQSRSGQRGERLKEGASRTSCRTGA